MRIALALAAAGMLLTVGSAVAQEPTPPMMRFPPLSDTPFLDLIRDASARMRLTDLRAAPRGARRELRLWDGFGLSGVQLLILRETASGWRAFYAPQVHGERRLRIANLPDTVAWASRWESAVESGLRELPPYPVRDSVSFVVMDGYSAVIEWFDGETYGVSGADNPGSYCSRDDQRLIAVLAAIVDHPITNRCEP